MPRIHQYRPEMVSLKMGWFAKEMLEIGMFNEESLELGWIA